MGIDMLSPIYPSALPPAEVSGNKINWYCVPNLPLVTNLWPPING